jgi:cytidylate kinase
MSATGRVIAIDGPAAAGKGTLARRLASHLGLPYLDTGLLYRAVARRVLNAGHSPNDPREAIAAAKKLLPADLQRTDLRTPEVDQSAASVAAIPGVRAALLAFQRSFGSAQGAVLDGRDIGTIIFPDAAAKFFVTASVEARAERRWKELQQKSVDVSLQSVLDDMKARDAADESRAAAPLVPAVDAVRLDTTHMNADEAFTAALAVLKDKRLEK